MFYFRERLSMTYLTYQFNHHNQLTDLIIGLFAIVTVLKLNGPEPSSFEPFWAESASMGLGPKDDLVGLNRSRLPASKGLN